VVESEPLSITIRPLKVLAVTLAFPSPTVNSIRPFLLLLDPGLGTVVTGKSVLTSPLKVSTLN
jgi:hypothetical protein